MKAKRHDLNPLSRHYRLYYLVPGRPARRDFNPLGSHRVKPNGARNIRDYNPRTGMPTLRVVRSYESSLRRPFRKRASIQTRYIQMLLEQDNIPRIHNILAAFFTWILLAGFVIFPGTFTQVQKSQTLASASDTGSEAQRKLLSLIRNAPLLWIAVACCVLGVLGMVWLWVRWRHNYVWVINRIFL